MTLRPVTMQDQAILLAWRNDLVTRQGSLTSDAVSDEAHQTWLCRVLESQDHLLYIGEAEGHPVGMIRFKRVSDQRADVSIVVAPEVRGRGFGTLLLQAGCNHVFTHWGAMIIHAYVKVGNIPSWVLFTRAGFHETARVFCRQA